MRGPGVLAHSRPPVAAGVNGSDAGLSVPKREAGILPFLGHDTISNEAMYHIIIGNMPKLQVMYFDKRYLRHPRMILNSLKMKLKHPQILSGIRNPNLVISTYE